MNLLKMNYIELVYFRKHFMLNCNFVEKMREKKLLLYLCTYEKVVGILKVKSHLEKINCTVCE